MLSIMPPASPLKRLAAYCWEELDLYKSLLTTEDDGEYLAFCRGAIAAGERFLEKLEEVESPSSLARDSRNNG